MVSTHCEERVSWSYRVVYNIQVIYFSTAMKKGDFTLKWVTVKIHNHISMYILHHTNSFLFVSTLDADKALERLLGWI